MNSHWQHVGLVCLHKLVQLWIAHRAVVEIGTQREQDDDRTTRLGAGSHQQIKEVTPLILRRRLGEQFLELVYQQHYFCPWSLRKLGGKQVQTTRRVVFQILANRFQALVGQVL